MKVQVIEGDLLDQPVDAIVNAWNRNLIPWWLLLPQGVSGAIKRRAGTGPFRELGWRPLPLGHARLTSAGRLPFLGIVHVAGIDGLWRASEASIRGCARHGVQRAVEAGFRSLAFPVIGAGSGGFPAARAEAVLVEALESLDAPLEVVVVRYTGR